MAVYKPIIVRKDEELSSMVKKLYRFSEDLRFTFSNLDEDNLEAGTIKHMQERNQKVKNVKFDSGNFEMSFADYEKEVYAKLEQTERKIGLLVEKGKVAETMVSRMELYGEHIALTTGHVTVDANNWKLDKEGNTEFSGEIIGGTIAIGNKFLVTAEGNVTLIGDTEQNFADGINRLTVAGNVEIEDSDYYGTAIIRGPVKCGSTVYCTYKATAKSFRYSSDARLKEGVTELEGASEVVAMMRPKRWVFQESRRPGMGFVAQDMYRIQDDLGVQTVIRQGKYLKLNYMVSTALFVKAVQENQERIEHIKERIEGRTHGSV